MFYIAGISIAFFLALLLLSKKNKTPADKILFAWLLVIGAHLALFTLRNVAQSLGYSYLLGIEIPFPLVHGPFLYLYTATMTNQLPADKKWGLLHFVVPILSVLLFSGFFSLPAGQKVEVYKNKGAGYESFITINLIAIYISGIVYVCWCSLLLWKHRKNIEAEFSDTEKINLNWLRYLVYGIGVIWILVLASDDNWIFGSVVIFILLLGFFGIKQTGIFIPLNKLSKAQEPVAPLINQIKEENKIHPETEAVNETINVSEEEEITEKAKKKYSKSGLSDTDAEKIHAELTKLVNIDKVYTEPEITLSGLASKLNTHPNHLSQVINEREGKNFYDFINTLRIEEFKRLAAMPENKNYTILSLAYECGFNSKSSFNRYFKKVTGTPPSEHIKK
jgi:AraC-like DNA-binding protein